MTVPDLEVKIFHGATDPILDVTLSTREAVVAVAGDTGAGKSKLLDLIAGFLRPERGIIRFRDRVCVDVDRRRWLRPEKRGMSLVPRGGALFPHLTVEENLAFAVRRPHAANLRRFQALVTTFNLTGLLNLLPARLGAREACFTAVARALVPGPDLLLLDEPDIFLGPASREGLEELLERILEFDVPVLFTTRSPEFVPPVPAGIRSVVVEMAPDQVAPMAERAARFFGEVITERDLAGRDRLVIARHPHR